jgi:hypothetical protein
MSKQCKPVGESTPESEALLVRWVVIFSGLLLIVLAAGSWYIFNWPFARSVLIGGMLVNGSFWLLKRDIQRLMQRVVDAEGRQGAALSFEKTRFFLRFYARLIVLGLLLFVLASQVVIDVIGLTLGLTTVMFSVVIIGLSTEKCWMPSKV